MVTRKKTLFFQKPKFREGVFIFSLVILPLIHFAVFWVYVNIGTVATTFQRWDILTGQMKWVGLERYKTMFTNYFLGYTNGNTATANIFWNSFRAILINAIIFPISLVASYAFYKKIPHEKFFRICFYLPSLISITVLTTVYRSLFHADFGPLTLLVKVITGKNPAFLANDSNSMWTLIYIFCIWMGLGSNVIMMTGAMLRIPVDIQESGRLEGIGFWRELWQIVLPLVMPTVGVYIINVFISPFSFTLHPMMIAQVGGVENRYYTVGWFIFDSVSVGSESGMQQASTLGMVLTLFMLPFIVSVRMIVKKFTPDVQY